MANSRAKAAPQQAVAIGPRDFAVIEAIGRYGRLTIDQVTRLFHSEGARTRAATRLKKLADAGYLTRRGIPTEHGTGPLVYSLNRLSHQLLKGQGVELGR